MSSPLPPEGGQGRQTYSLRSPSLSPPCRTDEASPSLQVELRFEASITQSVLAIVLCVIGYLLVCPRLELDRLKDFYLEKSEYQELRAREALTLILILNPSGDRAI